MTDVLTAPDPPDGERVSRWSPNQRAARARIADAAARLMARDGLAACTVRAVADESGLKKSTVHYYVDDVNDLVDLAVLTFLGRLAADLAASMDRSPDGREALCVLVRMFMGRGDHRLALSDSTLWSAYTVHAWKRGAHAEVLTAFDTFSALFTAALERCGVADAEERGRAIHYFLLGAVQRNIVAPIPRGEIAQAVSALSGMRLDDDRC